jgi:hypothetical protein
MSASDAAARTILDLQRTVGNQFVNRLLQEKQAVEHEAAILPRRHSRWKRLTAWISNLFRLGKDVV